MNYTENYHLPQWEETDRIMRADFNDAMDSLDSGLAACRDMAEAGGAQAKSDLYAGLFRMAYNHWHAAAALESFPAQSGAFRQGFSEGGNVTGMLRMGEEMWMANCTTPLTMEEVRPSMDGDVILSSTSGTKGVINFSFTPPRSGCLSAINLSASYDQSGGSNTGACNIEMWNDNRIVIQRSGNMGLTGSGKKTVTLPVDFPLHMGVRHTIRIRMVNLDFTAKISFLTETECLSFSTYKRTSAQTTYSLQAGADGLGGLALVHYRMYGPESALTLDWDGETLVPSVIRTITDSQGRSVQEAEFRLETPVPASSELQLALYCGEDEDISLYDWGAILI